MAPPKKRALPKPLPEGFILTDAEKKRWRLGKIIGQGGFGLIYLASQDVDRPVAADTDFVIKVEYHENGPLFSELKFYQRAAKPESMEQWKRSRKLHFLGIPAYWGSGLAEHNDLRYRFMAMDRLGCDLQKVCEKNRGRLKKTTVLQLGQRLVTVLEYIHENEYVHADIKAANLMLGYRDTKQVYLADYGLSYRYCPDGIHKPYKENPKKGHNGTIEYTSLDAHKGLAPSRRSDFQILGFCLLHWLCGSLPWDSVLKDPVKVQEAKIRLMDNLPDSVQQLSVSGASTDELAKFLLYVKTLDYEEKPDYQYLKAVLASVVTKELDFSMPQGLAELSATKEEEPPAKGKKLGRGTVSPKGKAGPTTVDDEQKEEKMKPKPVQGCNRKGPSQSNPQSAQREARAMRLRPTSVVTYKEHDSEDDEEEEEDMEDEEEEEMVHDNTRPRPISKHYLRGPPTGPRAQPKERADRVLPATRSQRRGPASVVTYEEDDSEDDEEEEEDTEVMEDNTKPRPISKRYLRGPPTGPRAQPKEKVKSKQSGTKTDDQTVTTEGQKRQLHLQKRKHTLKNQIHMEYREKLDQVQLRRKAGNSHRQRDGVLTHENTECLGKLKRSALRGPEEEPRPTQGRGLLSWLVFVCVSLFLGTVLAVCQSDFKPF